MLIYICGYGYLIPVGNRKQEHLAAYFRECG